MIEFLLKLNNSAVESSIQAGGINTSSNSLIQGDAGAAVLKTSLLEANLSHAINFAKQTCLVCDFSSSVSSCSPIPVIDLTNRCFLLSSSCYNNKRSRSNSIHSTFEEGTSAFTGYIALSLLEKKIDSHHIRVVVDDEKKIDDSHSFFQENYSFKTVTATLLFNMGICKAHSYDYKSAKSYFQQAFELLLEVKSYVLLLDSATTTATLSGIMKQQVLATHMLLTSITLLNLGHVNWHLSDYDNSIYYYRQCFESLQYLESAAELHSEALFYGGNYGCLSQLYWDGFLE